MVHLGDGALGFNGGQRPPAAPVQLLAREHGHGRLSGDGRPEIVISDKGNAAMMIYRNASFAGRRPVLQRVTDREERRRDGQGERPGHDDRRARRRQDPDGGPKLVASVSRRRTAPR